MFVVLASVDVDDGDSAASRRDQPVVVFTPFSLSLSHLLSLTLSISRSRTRNCIITSCRAAPSSAKNSPTQSTHTHPQHANKHVLVMFS